MVSLQCYILIYKRMFEKKQNIESPKETPANDLNYTDNIFKELSWELDLWEEKKSSIQTKKKTPEDYMKLWVLIFSILNISLGIYVGLSYFYVKFQNDPSYYSKAIIDPFCWIFLGDLQYKNTGTYCSWVSALLLDYRTKLDTEKTNTLTKLVDLFPNVYALENFLSSKEVTFLVGSKLDKLPLLQMLNDFDKLKNDFAASDKKMIECSWLNITHDNELSMQCDILTSSWERIDAQQRLGIVWVTWDRTNSLLEWTSMTAAASFLNFIEKNPWYNFQLLEKQKVFQSEFIGEWPYVRKTSVTLRLKYNNLANNLSL